MSNTTTIDSIYIYHPTPVAPPIFAALFLGSLITHLWQCYQYKSWKWTSLHPFCCLLFIAGYILREYGAFNYDIRNATDIYLYMASTALIYMAPPLLELANYHVLGRILYFVPYLSPLHPGRVLTSFGALSVVVEVLNAIGASYSLNPALPENLRTAGTALAKASLIIQIVVIGLFAVLAGLFHRRCAAAVAGGLHRHRGIRVPLNTLYVSMALILVRCVYRTVEYFSMSPSGSSIATAADLSPVVTHEWYYWVFEASLMLLNSLLWSVWHPARYLPRNKNVYLERDGVTEVEGPGWDDDRSFWVTLMDPFGMMKTKEQQRARSVSKTEPVSQTTSQEHDV
ncbi:RTA1 like protein-domain-containing protein [Xylariales sp. PMI_506]|nr:RTA1 like protein-domain-containing protein [Xylariales sp. PMI_506]